MWKMNVNIGIWYVRNLFWSGALTVLYNELSELDFDIVALQDNQWKVVYKNLMLHYLRVDQKEKKRKRHEFGCGFYVRGEFFKIC
jgi:hypothetical protein